MSDPVKRVNYFDHQFLRVADFGDEQRYHVMMRRLHNQQMHTPGIAQGLTVTLTGSTITVANGMAIDSQGREIYLVNPTTLDASTIPTPGSVYVTIAYGEQTSDTTTEPGGQGDTRWTELPTISLAPNLPTDTTLVLVLGKVTRQDATTFTVDTTGRSGAVGAVGVASVPPPPLPTDLVATSLSLQGNAVAQAQWPKLTCTTPSQAALAGSLTATGGIVAQSGSVGGVNLGQTGTGAANSGMIASPMFNVSQPISCQAATSGSPISATFSTSGGTVLVLATGTGFVWTGAGMQIGMEIVIDNVSRGFAKCMTNENNSHKSFALNPLVITGLLANNSHTIVLKSWNGTVFDYNDFFSVTILELPF